MPALFAVEVKYHRIAMAESEQDALTSIGPVRPMAILLLDDILLNGLCHYLKQIHLFHRANFDEMMVFTMDYLRGLNTRNADDVADYIVNMVWEELNPPAP